MVRARITRWRGLALLMGPALVASAAYVDPGNVATNTSASDTLGPLAALCFAVALLFSGLASGADPTTALIYSQVVLSFGIPFALIPLLSEMRTSWISLKIMRMTETDVTLRARRRQNQWLRILAIVLVVLTPLMYAALFILSDGQSSLLFWAVLSLVVTAVALVPLGLVLWLRRRGTAWAQPSLLLGVDQKRRKAIVKAVRAGHPVEERDHEIAVNAAQGLVRQRRLLWLVPFFLLLWTWNLLDGEWEPWDALIVIGIVGVCASVPFQIRDARQGHQWLEKYASGFHQ